MTFQPSPASEAQAIDIIRAWNGNPNHFSILIRLIALALDATRRDGTQEIKRLKAVLDDISNMNDDPAAMRFRARAAARSTEAPHE